MMLSLEHSIAFAVITFTFSVGGAYALLKSTAAKADEADGKAEAIGGKIDAMKNELIELKTAIDKDIVGLKREIEHFHDNHVTRRDIENLMSKKECESKFSNVVKKSELTLILEKIDLRFIHLEKDTTEIKKDIKDILKILRDKGQKHVS